MESPTVKRTTPRRRQTSSSALGFFLWTMFCVGFGILAGFGLFLILYQNECQALVQEARQGAMDDARGQVRREIDEYQFNTQALQAQVQGVRQTATAELEQMRTAHADEVTELKQEMRRGTDTSATRIKELVLALEEQAVSLSAQQQQQQQQQAASEKDSDKAKIQRLAEEIARLQQALSDQRVVTASLHQDTNQNGPSQQLQTLQFALQQRFLEQTKLKYGSETLQVELTLDLGDERDLQTIVIQIDHLQLMPMTTATFFYLLEAGLYTGTTLYVADDKTILHGGQPPADRTQAATRWVAHGYARKTPLLWANETSTRRAPCVRYGFGLDWHAKQGGDFFIQLSSSGNLPSSRPCVGRVVRGMGLLGPDTKGTLAHARVRAAPEDVPSFEEL